jgi:pimeloyl-ACP methyl ester carboxylesterase
MHVELVRTVTRDSMRLDGALAAAVLPPAGQMANSHRADTRPTAAILLHGVAGNFYTSSTFEPLMAKLPAQGIAALAVNTRGHDSVHGASQGGVRRQFGAAYETVDDCRHDVLAWVEFLKQRGHQRIALVGHSLGAIKAVYAQAHEPCPEIAAVIAVSGPRLSYSAFMNSDQASVFFESYSTAQRMDREGRGGELFQGQFPFPILITASEYIDKYGPEERYNLLKFASGLPGPALFIYGSRELASGGIAFAGMPEALLALPGAAWRRAMVIEGGDHVYSGVSQQLADRIVAWLLALPDGEASPQ